MHRPRLSHVRSGLHTGAHGKQGYLGSASRRVEVEWDDLGEVLRGQAVYGRRVETLGLSAGQGEAAQAEGPVGSAGQGAAEPRAEGDDG